MLKGIYIIAGHSQRAKGAKAYNGLYEHHYTTLVQSEMIKLCQAQNIPCKTDSETMPLSQVVNWIDTTIEQDWHVLDIHFNYANPNATGVEVFVDPNTTEQNKAIASRMVHNFSKEFGYPIRRMESNRDYKYPAESARGQLAMFEGILIEQTKPPVILIECCFLNEQDLSIFDPKRAAQCILAAYLTPSRNLNLQLC